MAQREEPYSNHGQVLTKENITITSFAYPSFMGGETHAYFSTTYVLDPKLEVELQGFYDTYLLGDVMRFSLRSKYFISKKLYFFGGLSSETEVAPNGHLSPIRLYLTNGAGINVNQNINLEAVYEAQINLAGPGIYGLPSSLTARAKFKFFGRPVVSVSNIRYINSLFVNSNPVGYCLEKYR